jgi:hypothetical protein
MSCQEAFFAEAHCRIDVEPKSDTIGETRFVARVSVVDAVSHEIRPLVFSDGSRVIFPAASEALALSSALTYLETRFGAYTESPYGCLDDASGPLPEGAPLVIEHDSDTGR